MSETNDGMIYSELYELIELLDGNDRSKIPDDIIKNIEDNRDKKYTQKYISYDTINENEVNEKTITLFTKLFLDYIATESEKNEIYEILGENDKKISEKYSIDNVFEKRKAKNVGEEITTSTALVEVKESKLKMIWNKILAFFKKEK